VLYSALTLLLFWRTNVHCICLQLEQGRQGVDATDPAWIAYLHDAEGKTPHPRTQPQLQLQQQKLSSSSDTVAAAATATTATAAVVQVKDIEQSSTGTISSSSSTTTDAAAIDDATVVSDTYTDAGAAADAVMKSHEQDRVVILEALDYMTGRMAELRSESSDVERTVAPLDEQFDSRVDQMRHWDAAAICTHDPAVAEYCMLKGQNQNLLGQREHGKHSSTTLSHTCSRADATKAHLSYHRHAYTLFAAVTACSAITAAAATAASQLKYYCYNRYR
jgi:hypothetical protein